MEKFKIKIIETRSKIVEQEAKCYDEAEEIVASKYSNSDIVLGEDCIKDIDYKSDSSFKLDQDFDIKLCYDSKTHTLSVYDEYDQCITDYFDCNTIEDYRNNVKQLMTIFPDEEEYYELDDDDYEL